MAWTCWSFMIFHFRSAAPAVHCGRGASIPASGIILAQFNRAPDSLPSDCDAQSGVGSREHRCSHCLRQLASLGGYPARSRHSSLRSDAENKPPSSAIPLGMTSGCRPSASHACKLSFLTRRTPASPRRKTPDANGCENAVRFSV